MAEYDLMLKAHFPSLFLVFVLSAVGYRIYRFLKKADEKEQEDLRYNLEFWHDTGSRSGDLSYDTHSQGRLFTVKAVMAEINEDFINRSWDGGLVLLQV